MQTGCLQPFVTELTRAVRESERHYYKVAGFDPANIASDVLNNADGFVAHYPRLSVRAKRFVRPQVTATDTGARDANESVGRFHDTGIRHIFYANVAGFIHYSC